MKLITINNGNASRRSHGYTYLLLGTKSFLSFSDASNYSYQANKLWFSLQVASYQGFWKLKAVPDNVLENRCLTSLFNLTLTSKLSSSVAAINIESCSVIILTTLPYATVNPATITQLTQ